MKVIAVKKPDGMTAIVYPCPAARGIAVIAGTPEIPAVPAKPEVKQFKDTPYSIATPEIPAVPAVPPQVISADGCVIPGLTQIESEDDFVNRIAAGLPYGTEYKIVEYDSLPNDDRDFFDAWAYGKAITVDLTKAKDIHREKIRRARVPVLAQLDIEYQRADESNDIQAKAAIAAKKQALRDLPKHKSIASAKSTGDLRNAGIDILATYSK